MSNEFSVIEQKDKTNTISRLSCVVCLKSIKKNCTKVRYSHRLLAQRRTFRPLSIVLKVLSHKRTKPNHSNYISKMNQSHVKSIFYNIQKCAVFFPTDVIAHVDASFIYDILYRISGKKIPNHLRCSISSDDIKLSLSGFDENSFFACENISSD